PHSLNVLLCRVGDENLLKRLPFSAHFKAAVAVRFAKSIVGFTEEFIEFGFGGKRLFRQHESASGNQTAGNLFQNAKADFRGGKLKREVGNDEGTLFEREIG